MFSHTAQHPSERPELLGVCASQFWRWMSLSNAITYFSAVLLRVPKTHEECCDVLLNLSACKSEAGTPVWECALCYTGGHHTDDNTRSCGSDSSSTSVLHLQHTWMRVTHGLWAYTKLRDNWGSSEYFIMISCPVRKQSCERLRRLTHCRAHFT
jgi:hypothetical protein